MSKKKGKWLVLMLAVALILTLVPAVGATENTKSATIYGNIGGYMGPGPQGDIYEIDPIARTETLIFDNPSTDFEANWYPNALAYDEVNHRLYFATGQNRLEFYDFSSTDDMSALTVAASGSPYFNNADNVLGAAFADGAYWYILNRSEKLYRVDFDDDGIATGRTEYVMTTDAPKRLTQGDIIFLEDGKIFGSSGTGASPAGGFRGFFTYEIGDTNGFQVVSEGDADFLAPQLAWGLDAGGEKVMYGTNQQNVWTVNTETGDMTPVTKADSDDPWLTDNRFQDLASVIEEEEPPPCELRTQGYWRNHPDMWPEFDCHPTEEGEGNENGLDGTKENFFGQGTWREVLWTPPRGGDAYYILAQQFIAAFLNVQSGCVPPEEVGKALDAASAYFHGEGAHGDYGAPGELTGRMNGDKRAAREAVLGWAEILDNWNNGLYCD